MPREFIFSMMFSIMNFEIECMREHFAANSTNDLSILLDVFKIFSDSFSMNFFVMLIQVGLG